MVIWQGKKKKESKELPQNNGKQIDLWKIPFHLPKRGKRNTEAFRMEGKDLAKASLQWCLPLELAGLFSSQYLVLAK